jgi:cell wall-associated NlpC family hydrolase
MDEKARSIITAARDCVGTPFRHQGRLPGIGLDCAGLVIHAAKSVGLTVRDYTGYPNRPFNGMLKRMLDDQICIREIYLTDVLPGDVLLMRVNQAPQHLAIVSFGNYIIHAYQNIGKVAEHGIDEITRLKIVAAYRFIYE